MPLTRRGFVAGGGAATAEALAGFAVRPYGGAPVLFGIYGGPGCYARPELAAFERWLGRRVELVVDFGEYRRGWRGMTEQAGWLTQCWRAGAGVPRLVLGVPMLMQGDDSRALRRGAEGAHDGSFRQLARLLSNARRGDTILRLGWEFNGSWYAWSAAADPAAFAAYWRRIVGTMRAAAPEARFLFDWNPALGAESAERAYPGDDVVDVIGLDAYNQTWPAMAEPERRWSYLLDHPTGLRWHHDFAMARGKPRSFPEWGTGTRPDGLGGGDDPLYIRNMFAWFRAGGPPVLYHCYWNAATAEYDSKVTANKFSRATAALRAELLARP